MKIELKDFQDDAVKDLLRELYKAKREVREGGLQTVVLSSPTGSGKTVITAALMEMILDGSEQLLAEPDAIFLWLSDQPELNEQSKKKVLASSDRIREQDVVVIDSFFDQETLSKGKLYFINTQKLGKDKLLVTKGNQRSYTIWETIQNTSQLYGDKFYLIIDEAHRGMNRSIKEENLSKTIVQKFILGDSESGIDPIGLIIGISATPERFLKLLQGSTRRIPRVIPIDPDLVRSSGLLKDKIVIYHPEVDQPTDWTLLSAAARQWIKIRDSWRAYTDNQPIPSVYPAMVIQVEDRNDTGITKTNLEQVIKTLEDEVGPISDDQLAHCFEEDIDIPVGGLRKVRKIEPSKIQDEIDIKFVFFKMSLTTGWDCPRAEVMMSFRTAQDHTLIAQLIGRMVRTPLARRIERNDFLNTVSLFLPHYNSEGLKKVVEKLKSDPDIVPPSSVESGNTQILLNRKEDFEIAFNELEKTPTYRIEKTHKVSNVRRLMKLSRLLTTFHNIDDEAYDESKELIINTIHSEMENLKRNDSEFDKIINHSDEILVRSVSVDQGTWQELEGEPIPVKLTDANITELFNRCGRRLGEGLNVDYWTRYYDRDNPNKPKLELFVTLQREDVFNRLEQLCLERLNILFDKHKFEIRALPSSEQERYKRIREQAREPEAMEFVAPNQIMLSIDIKSPKCKYYNKHLYVMADGSFPAILNGWEGDVIEQEIARDDVVGWVRNYDRKSWALCIPYEDTGESREIKPMYPDFLVVRRIRDNYIVDILEPHRGDFDDNWKKAVGLAQFARDHSNSFGRIELIRKIGDNLKRLDLNNHTIRLKVLSVTNNDHLNDIFKMYSI